MWAVSFTTGFIAFTNIKLNLFPSYINWVLVTKLIKFKRKKIGSKYIKVFFL